MRWFRRKTCLTSRITNCLSPYCRQQETTSGNNESGADCTENLTDTARKPENNFHKENTSYFSMKISTLQEAASCLPRSSSLHGQMLLFAHSIATSCRRAEKGWRTEWRNWQEQWQLGALTPKTVGKDKKRPNTPIFYLCVLKAQSRRI